VDKVRAAADGISFNSPMGPIKIDGATQHIYQKAYMGTAQADGQFKIVWDSGADALKPDPYLKTYAWGTQVTGS
jgi:urea transport system substrate-binding protein